MSVLGVRLRQNIRRSFNWGEHQREGGFGLNRNLWLFCPLIQIWIWFLIHPDFRVKPVIPFQHFVQNLSVYVMFFHTLHFANWHFLLRRYFYSIIPSAGFSSRCREYYIWQDREPKLRKMWSNKFFAAGVLWATEAWVLEVGSTNVLIHYEIKLDGSLAMQTNWLTLNPVHRKHLNCIQFSGERRMERRAGSLVSQGSAEKNAGEDIAALLDRLKIIYSLRTFSDSTYRQQSTRNKPTRKPSIGQRFSSIASLTSQMAASMAAMSVTDMVASPLGQVEIEPNLIVDKLIPEIIYAATNKSVLKILLHVLTSIVFLQPTFVVAGHESFWNFSNWGKIDWSVQHIEMG